MADFITALEYCIENEGGFVDKKEDRGGPTNMGVTKEMLAKFRGRMVSTEEIKLLTDNEVAAVYERYFWEPLKISGLSQAVATAILDTAINMGQSAAIKLAQEALGPKVACDGIMGNNTLQLLLVTDIYEFILKYIDLIQTKYVKICMYSSNQMVFLEGWLKRSRRLFRLTDIIEDANPMPHTPPTPGTRVH